MLCAGHTPFQEWMVAGYESGFADVYQYPEDKHQRLSEDLEEYAKIISYYYGSRFTDNVKKRVAPQPRDIVIGYAIGAYVRIKFDQYITAKLYDESFEKQKQYFSNYEKYDSFELSPEKNANYYNGRF